VGRLITVEELPQYAGGELKLDSLGAGHPDFRMRMFHYRPSDIMVPPGENYLVVVYRQGITTMHRRVGSAWQHGKVGSGTSTLLTRATASHWRWGDEMEVGHFYIAPKFMFNLASEMFDREIGDLAFRDLLDAQDPVLDWVSRQLAHEVSNGAPGGRLCFDALALQAGVHLLRNYATLAFKPPRAQGRFAPAQARLIEDYIEHNLARNITLEELARVCNCTPAQFARKFRVHYRMRPHAFVQQRRVEKARSLLGRGGMALKEIALECGFADQSHLNRVFRKWSGCSPGQYRQANALIIPGPCPPPQMQMHR